MAEKGNALKDGRGMREKTLIKFRELFGSAGEIRTFFAPGRVNLIGEHTDYNGGHVFPCALTMGTFAAVRKRGDRKLRFYSMNMPQTGVVESSLDDLVMKAGDDWANYPKGVVWAFGEKGYVIPAGFDMVVYGDIPGGAGLSSSAALEVLTGVALRGIFDLDVTRTGIALIGQFAENQFNGMNCGIMDQFASAMGRRDCAIFLDTATLEYEYVPVKLKGEKIIITNSNVKHSLVGSDYNTRRKESAAALKKLQAKLDIRSLGELDEAEFEAYKYLIDDDTERRRAKHAVYENQRTIKAVEALKADDLAAFGKLINASHRSLRDDYETSCPEVDILVEEAWKVPGVLGSRITGGGFGGCTVSIVKNDAVVEFEERVGRVYRKKTGITAAFYEAGVGAGAREF